MIDDPFYHKLAATLQSLGRFAVAFSGGADSSFLLAAAKNIPGVDVIALTVDSPALPRRELKDAVSVASSLGVRHVILQENNPAGKVLKNPELRCYFCKKNEFGRIIRAAKRLGYDRVLDGTNADDADDFRPGMKALAELGIISPLRDAGITKMMIRIFAKALGLAVWDKPAYACLYSRIPYGTRIRKQDLEKIEKAEDFLRDRGFRNVRVRLHGDVARIEVDPQEREKLLKRPLDSEIVRNFKSYGFRFVSMDLEGYRTGSLNEALKAGI